MAYVPGIALVAALAVGCSASTGTGGSAPDSKSGESTVTVAAPGKYRTLPDPCRAITSSTLEEMFPGSAELTEDQQEELFAGTATVTYDTDRKVGCRWKAETTTSSHTLFIDFERVVSYDPTVSDDDRASEVYAEKEAAAGLSSPSTAPSDTKATKEGATPSDSADSADDSASGSKTESTSGSASHALSGSDSEEEATDGTTGATTDGDTDGGTDGDTAENDSSDSSGDSDSSDGSGGEDDSLAPRVLDNLADNAFLNDSLTREGSTAQNRTVSVVFRTSNVIVTIEYTAQPTVSTVVPDSKELQDKARSLAQQLVNSFTD
ncbi:DUF3558 domain-containing protein [Streptomyces sp. NPDC052052]|uniref:DUF3558 domain-containing protein n=1 Tax=Streptomyces sp. NPDC052052 TaxID=3154756 RepID=UPI00343A454B